MQAFKDRCTVVYYAIILTLMTSTMQEVSASICNRYWQELCGRHHVTLRRTSTDSSNDAIISDVATASVTSLPASPQSVSRAGLRLRTRSRSPRGCRNDIKQFVCQFIAHTCEHDAVTSFPPCRESCTALMHKCLPPSQQGVVSWMEFMNCDVLPLRASYTCISSDTNRIGKSLLFIHDNSVIHGGDVCEHGLVQVQSILHQR